MLVLKKFELYTSSPFDNASLFHTHVEKIWTDEPNLSLSFPTVKIAFAYPHYTIIPDKLYRESSKANYLTPLKKQAAFDELYFTNELSSIGAKLVFSLPEMAVNFFQKVYDSPINYLNIFSCLIKGYQKRMSKLHGKQVWINVHPRNIQVLLFEQEELIFSNQFDFQSEKDFIYYVLLIYDQFKLHPENVPLHISGQLVKESAIYKNLDNYIRNIRFVELDPSHRLSSQIIDSPFYFFFDLLEI